MTQNTYPDRTIITNGLGTDAFIDSSTGAVSVLVGNTSVAPVVIGDDSAAVTVAVVDIDNAAGAVNQLVTQDRMRFWNGTGWDRAPGTIANGLDVDVTRLPALPTGSNVIGQVQITNGSITLPIDTAHNDGESATENHLDISAKTMGLNGAGTFDIIRANVNVNKTATYTTAQTGVALWTPAAGKAVVVTNLQIQSYGTTAGTCVVWFGGAADTAYTRGTDFPIFDGEFAPSATNKPGVIHGFTPGVRGAADFVLRVTTTNAQSVTVSVWGYEI